MSKVKEKKPKKERLVTCEKEMRFRLFLREQSCRPQYEKNLKKEKNLTLDMFMDSYSGRAYVWLDHCFSWSNQPEGYDYWSDVNYKWEQLVVDM